MTFHETTENTLSTRRLGVLSELAAVAAVARSPEQAWNDVALALERHPLDVPFAVLYAISPGENEAVLKATVGLPSGHPASPSQVHWSDSGPLSGISWPSAASTTPLSREVALREFPGILVPSRAWPESCWQAMVVPLRSSLREIPLGFLVIGASPRRRLDDAYKQFFTLVAEHVVGALLNSRAHAEERSRALQLAELDRVKTRFFSNVSHEFRTPLTLILGTLESVMEQPEPMLTHEQLAVCHRNANRLKRLVGELLDITRLEAGQMKGRFQPTRLAAFTSQLAGLFREAIETKGLEYRVEAAEPERATADAFVDPEMWETIVFNLLSNALKYTRHGRIGVLFRYEPKGAVLEVVDSGVGIPAEHRGAVFDRFHRVDENGGEGVEGTGLGLSIVSELVKLHGGTISVHSEPGQGSRFRVTLPLGCAHLPSDQVDDLTFFEKEDGGRAAFRRLTTPTHASGLPHGGSAPKQQRRIFETRGRRLLLVEDNADMSAFIHGILEAQGWQVTHAGSGDAALEAMAEEIPDIILSDVMMPGMDGLAFLKAVRDSPRLRKVPLVLLSARAGEEAALEGLAAGADDYLVKPFSRRDLLARLEATHRLAVLREDAEEQRRLAQENQRLYHQTLQALRLRDDFLSIASHELRTPLTPLLMQFHYMKEHVLALGTSADLPVPLEKVFASTDRQFKRIVRLVDDLLDAARLSQGDLSLEMHALPLDDLLADMCAQFRPGFQKVGADLVLVPEGEAGSPCLVQGDRVRLEQVLTNLLSNALRFGAGNPVQVTYGRHGDGKVFFAVQDAGIGIAESDLERIFRRFERAVTARHFGGLGLGLYLSAEIVNAHGGTLAAQSVLGEGSTFTVELPG